LSAGRYYGFSLTNVELTLSGLGKVIDARGSREYALTAARPECSHRRRLRIASGLAGCSTGLFTLGAAGLAYAIPVEVAAGA